MRIPISVIGKGTLATATRECCENHFWVSPAPSADSHLLWFCEDMPTLAEQDHQPDTERLFAELLAVAKESGPAIPILISSQIPVGTTARLQKLLPDFRISYSPENIRVASAVADFENQARVVVGVDGTHDIELFQTLFAPFTKNIIFTTPETAECCKLFLNTFLALNVVFGNELGRLCKAVGADGKVVAEALRAERRISPSAPIMPGAPYGGGHLEREVWNVMNLAKLHDVNLPVIDMISFSNSYHTDLSCVQS